MRHLGLFIMMLMMSLCGISQSNSGKSLAPQPQREGFVMLNGAYSIAPQFSIGLTAGVQRTWGWWVSLATNLNSDFPEFTQTDIDGTADYYYTGSKKTSRLSLQAGGMYKFSRLFSAKVGMGYGYRKVGYSTLNNGFVKIDNQCFQGLEYSVGLHLGMHETSFSVDLSTIGFSFRYAEVKLGVGYNFKLKNPKPRKNIKP
ncbi:MAG: hypothetical protein IKD33_02415 [Bacteroidales bacterium]|nr:hypothetical protein [Bacteroidales bacterium]